jgi:hypothetical protein
MATQIKSDAMVSGRGQRAAIGGTRQRRGVAVIGALMLALAVSVAVSQALSARPADSGAPVQARVIQQDPDADADAMARWARPADTFDWEQWERTQTGIGAGYLPGFTETREDHRPLVPVAEPGFTDYREDHRAVVGPAYTFPAVYGDDKAR